MAWQYIALIALASFVLGAWAWPTIGAILGGFATEAEWHIHKADKIRNRRGSIP